jgi:hypothetical protein
MSFSIANGDSDLMHEVECEAQRCGNKFYCTCGKMKFHTISSDMNFCPDHRREHDPRYDPDDQMDQGGGVGGEATFPPYQPRHRE